MLIVLGRAKADQLQLISESTLLYAVGTLVVLAVGITVLTRGRLAFKSSERSAQPSPPPALAIKEAPDEP